MITHTSRVSLLQWLRPATQALLDLVFPPHCVACGQGGSWLCGACQERVPFLAPPLCPHCGRGQSGAGLCAKCQASSSYLDAIRSVAPHLWPLRPAVHALKYEGVRVLAAPLADLLAQCWQAHGHVVDVIVPVPLHARRVRQRGYNQAEVLARAVGPHLALPVLNRALVRHRDTRSQVGLSAQARWDNVWGAFGCQSQEIAGARVLLLDDVFTTGATLEVCAHTLLEAGATQVCALTLTRALDPDDDLADSAPTLSRG